MVILFAMAAQALVFEPQAGVSADGGVSRGVAFADLDGDRDPDVVFANTDDGILFVYRNDGSGRFSRWGDPSLDRVRGNLQGVSMPDYDNDGLSDLFIAAERGPNYLIRNRGAEGFELVEAGDLTANDWSSTQSCWADYDGDGRLDVYVVNADNQDDAMFLQRQDGFVRHPGPWEGRGDNGRSCAAGDPDGDGRPDLYVANATRVVHETTVYAPNIFYRNGGSGAFEAITDSEFTAMTGYSYGVSWFDSDQDGDEDLFVSNISRYEPNWLFENIGGSHFRPLWSSIVMRDVPGPGKGHAWGDFDNDGRPDLFVAEGHGGARPEHAPFDNVNRYYRQSEGGFEVAELGDATRGAFVSAGTAAADADGDGDLDLVISNWSGDDLNNQFFRNPAGGGFVRVRLEGRVSNRQGIGARIVLDMQGTAPPQYRSIWLNNGYASMSEPVAHFGTGRASPRALEVRWPSGRVDRFEGIEAGRRYVVRESGEIELE